MTELLDLCYDVLIRILEEINPEDIAACAQTSSGFSNFIKKNKRLYKAHYLQNFDDPRSPTEADPEWVFELQNLIRCQKILESANNDLKRDEFLFVTSTVLSLISTASSSTSGYSHNQHKISKFFLHISQNHSAFMCRSSLYSRAGTELQKPASDEESRQTSAKLHCLFGIPSSSSLGRRVLGTHPYARSRVYDLRNYTDATQWGPYRHDGSMRVDWEMIESLMIILGYNTGLCCRRFAPRFEPPWNDVLEGVVPEYQALTIKGYPSKILYEPDVPLRLKDPYGVSGVWSRIVCFLDYNDLYAYNFSAQALKHPSDTPREPLITDEAIRHIIMDISVTEIVPATDKDDSDALPVVYFAGISRSVDATWDPNANSKIRGSVRLTREAEVRWQTISVFHGGEERWRSEGIQVGGLKAQRGVIGTWFDKDFDPHGPAGPTAFWKISDRNLEDDEEE
ncbi:hypothetical protein BDU57DRAFT_551544 [Ampelomyces quisqualis]|uniref:F-box domain-containing protein n=1 Tax=Ampelomyces quisqualis TaxID=50730 RepID=A0A6A5QBR7_AMPQU|nr:hypothetical protein BDU57DRAFT_551544 [Ampelomyces quisqualis]